jgi:hypothetical protein
MMCAPILEAHERQSAGSSGALARLGCTRFGSPGIFGVLAV